MKKFIKLLAVTAVVASITKLVAMAISDNDCFPGKNDTEIPEDTTDKEVIDDVDTEVCGETIFPYEDETKVYVCSEEAEKNGKTNKQKVQESAFADDDKYDVSEVAKDGCETVSGENP